MKQQICFILAFCFLTASCVTSRHGERAPTSVPAFPGRWLYTELTAENCHQYLPHLKNEALSLDQQKTNLKLSETELKEFEKQSFLFREKFASQTANWPNECIVQLRQVFNSLRSFRDYVAERSYEKNPGLSFQVPDLEKFQFQTGDVLLTRGSSFLSATISQVSSNKNHYSHVAYVYVDPNTKAAYTMESYPTKGARVYPMAEALKNDNNRILLLRPRDRQKAERAAHVMHEKILRAIQNQKIITYDYRYDENDHNRLSCVEVLQEPYDLEFREKIPHLKSKIQIQNPKILKSLGIANGDFFVPGDLETDPRFQVVFEWTDYRKTVEQRMQDAIVRKMLHWTSEEKYQLQGSLKTFISRGLLSFRNSPNWELFSARFGMGNVPMEIPAEILVTMVKFNDIGRVLMDFLIEEDRRQVTTSQRHLTESEIESALEKFRLNDRDLFMSRRPAPLHLLFRPYELNQYSESGN